MGRSKILTTAVLANAAAVVCCSLLSYLIGGVIGFNKGLAAGVQEHAIGETVNTVTALQALRKGEADKAISLLDLNLDANIAMWALYEEARHSTFNLTRWTVVGELRDRNAALSTALLARYLKEHPSNHTEIQEFIQAKLQYYAHLLPDAEGDNQ